jgi:hypothetical protein
VTPLQRFRYGHAVLRRETVDVDGHA